MMIELHKNIIAFIALLTVAAAVDRHHDEEKAEAECNHRN
jgi:hypothetical protein